MPAAIKSGNPPAEAFTLDEVEGVAVVPKLAAGRKCARSWRITDDVGSDPAYPSLSARDASGLIPGSATLFAKIASPSTT